MSEQAFAVPAASAVRPTRAAFMLTAVGVMLVMIPMAVVALIMIDKPHFGGLVGTWFLPIITSGVIVGSLVVLVGTWLLHARGWRQIVLFAWALVALTSPLFGIMFLLPWGLLVVTLPLIVMILTALRREARATTAQ